MGNWYASRSHRLAVWSIISCSKYLTSDKELMLVHCFILSKGECRGPRGYQKVQRVLVDPGVHTISTSEETTMGGKHQQRAKLSVVVLCTGGT